MNWDRIEGDWKQFKGNVKQQWGKITDDQLDVIAGKREHLAGKIQEAYGVSKDEAEKQLAGQPERDDPLFVMMLRGRGGNAPARAAPATRCAAVLNHEMSCLTTKGLKD